MTKIKSAVIGCGRMGAFTSHSVKEHSPKCWLPLSHIEALINCPDTFVASICDTNPEFLGKAKFQYDIENDFEDYSKMLEVINPELLSIATRTLERTKIIKKAINTGVKAIHLEKPICNSMEQLDELCGLVKDHDIALTYGTIRRYFDIYAKAKEIVRSGELGNLQEIEINFGPGQIFWLHPHSVDIILFFADYRNVTSVEANLSNVVLGFRDDLISSDPQIDEAKIYFDDGCVGKITKRPGMDVILHCSGGRVIIEGDGRRVVVLKLNNSKVYFEFPGEVFIKEDERPEGTMAAISQLVNQLTPDIIPTKFTPTFDKNHIFNGQRILFGFAQSYLDQKGPVALNDIRPSLYILGKTGELYA
jgi:scyllo-inositol 2-dehydrogenase (NAD+)